MSTSDAREEARYRQDVLRSYRAWLAYLESQQTILALASDAQAAADPFEGASAAQERADAAQRRLASLPTDQRTLFDAVAAEERAQIQRQFDAGAQVRGGTVTHADPDEVARQAMAHLIEEAQGLHRDDRRGLVPRGTPDAIKWLVIDLAEVAHAPPSATDYQLGGGRRDARRGMIVNIGFAVLALLAIPVVILLLQPGRPDRTATGAPTSGGAALSPWRITLVRGVAGDWSLPVQASQTRWDAACAGKEATTACALTSSFRPIQLCLPAARLEALDTLLLDAPDGQPTRVFALATQPQGGDDLVIHPCATGDTATAPRYGHLQDLQAQPVLVPGDAAPAGFRVMAITVRGRGEDPTLPEGRVVLTVAVADADGQDWVARAPTIRLADGSAALPSATRPETETIAFDYLIPDPVERFDVVWQVAANADQVVRYRATLESPPTRDAILRARLRVDALTAQPGQQTMTVQATLFTTSPAPLVLTPADLGFVTPSARSAVAAPALGPPLAPGERRVVVIDLPLESGVLQIGPFRYQLTVRR